MSPDPRLKEAEEESSDSSDDSDFAPENENANASNPPSDESDDSDDDEPGRDTQNKPSTAASQKKRPYTGADGEEDKGNKDVGFENSGDEAIIGKARRRKKKKQKHGADDEDEDGGEGGLIKTRSMRAQEKAEKKFAVASGPVTVDVDAIWAQMLTGSTAPAPSQNQDPTLAAEADNDTAMMDIDGETPLSKEKQPANDDPSSMVRIKRTYNFAGRVHTEEKLVPRDSAEAKLHFASQNGENGQQSVDADNPASPPRRILKRAFRSAYEPAIEASASGLLLRNDLNLGVTLRLEARNKSREAQAKKINTVEKSRMDWAGYVDKEGLKDELELAGRSKESYAERQGFLQRSEAKREEDAWKARMAGRV